MTAETAAPVLSDKERYARRKRARVAIEEALRAEAHMWAHGDGPDFALASDVAMDALGDTAAEILSDGTMLRSMRVENGEIVLELAPAREILLTLVASMRTMLEEYGAENYLETEITAPAITPGISLDLRDGENPLDAYTVTIQRRTRPTPHEFRQRADRDRAKILDLVSAYVVECNDCGGLDANDLVTRLSDAGFELPGGED